MIFVNMPPRKTKTTKKTVKKDTSWQLTTIPLHSWVIFWALVLATMALATVCFTTAFRPAQPEVDDEALAMFQAVRESLEQQVAELEGKVEEAGTAYNGRLLITGIPGPGDDDDCDLALATSTADVYVPHLNVLTGVSVSIPYNFDWGNDEYAFVPVVTINESFAQTLVFGPGVPSKCGSARDVSLEISTSTSTPNEARREAIDLYNADTVQERIINGMRVLSYKMNIEAAQNNVWIGFGRTYRYKIFSLGWLTDAEAVKIIQSLRVTQ
jgi:hypothetical protein